MRKGAFAATGPAIARALVVVLGLGAVQLTAPASGASAGPPQEPAEVPSLDAGIRQAREGDFRRAILTLDAAAIRLATSGEEPKALARAYAYLALAYHGLGQQPAAKARLLAAVRTDPGLTLSPAEFPPALLQLFEAAKRQAALAPSARGASRTEAPGGPSPGLIAAAAGATAGFGILLAWGGEPTPPPPDAGTPLEAVAVPAGGQVVFSRTILERDSTYTLRASGTVMIGGAVLADAEYGFSGSSGQVLDQCTEGAVVDVGIGVNDAAASGRKSPVWGSYSPAHVYSVTFNGQGAPISLSFHDCAHADNSGTLTVEIIR